MVSLERVFPSSPDIADNLLRQLVRLPKVYWYLIGFLGLAAFGSGLVLLPQLTIITLGAVAFGIPALLFAWKYPEIILVVVVFLSSGFISGKRMEIGGGLELRDAAFLGSLGLLIFQGILRKKFEIPWWRVAAPLIVFLAIAILSLINALLFENVAANWAFNDMRILIYYAMFFSCAWAVKSEKQLQYVLLGLFIIADLIALIIFAQQPLGADNPLLESMISSRWDLHDQGVAVRVVPAAHALMHFMAVISFALIFYAGKAKRVFWFGLLQFGFLNAALMLTFTRSQWLATAIGIFLICIVVIPQYKDRFIRWGIKYSVPTVLLLICILGIFGTTVLQTINTIPIVGGVVERASTIFTPSETLETNSLEWREFEFQKGWEALKENPFLGVSLGNNYREVTTLQGEALGWWTDGSLERNHITRFTRYIHSSYLAIAVKMGVFGLTAFLLFCLLFIFEGWKLTRRMPLNVYRGVALAIIASFIGLMQWSIFHTHFMRTESTIAIGIMTGIVASINYLNEKNVTQSINLNVTKSENFTASTQLDASK